MESISCEFHSPPPPLPYCKCLNHLPEQGKLKIMNFGEKNNILSDIGLNFDAISSEWKQIGEENINNSHKEQVMNKDR